MSRLERELVEPRAQADERQRHARGAPPQDLAQGPAAQDEGARAPRGNRREGRVKPSLDRAAAALTARACWRSAAARRVAARPMPNGGGAGPGGSTSGAIVIRPASAAGDSGRAAPGHGVDPARHAARGHARRSRAARRRRGARRAARRDEWLLHRSAARTRTSPARSRPRTSRATRPSSSARRRASASAPSSNGSARARARRTRRTSTATPTARPRAAPASRSRRPRAARAASMPPARAASASPTCTAASGSGPTARGGAARRTASLGVLRGGNAVAGELVARCANAIGRPTGEALADDGPPLLRRHAQRGDRAAHGEGHAWLPDASATPRSSTRRGSPCCAPRSARRRITSRRAWKWSPVAERGARHDPRLQPGRAADVRARGRARPSRAAPRSSRPRTWGRPSALPDVARIGDARHLRIRGLDPAGTFGRDITYVYGRVEISRVSRP